MKLESFIVSPFRRKDNDNLELLQTKITDLEEEINSLKEELELNKTNTHLISANVIVRNHNDWYKYIVIDKGEDFGIKENMIVITYNGLIGSIDNVSKNYSRVSLITSANSNISVGVKGKNGYHHGLVTSYKDGLLVISGLTSYDYIYTNSKVVTTGINNLSSGYLIGYVKKMEDEIYDISKKIYVESKQNFDDIRYVSVVMEE